MNRRTRFDLTFADVPAFIGFGDAIFGLRYCTPHRVRGPEESKKRDARVRLLREQAAELRRREGGEC